MNLVALAVFLYSSRMHMRKGSTTFSTMNSRHSTSSASGKLALGDTSPMYTPVKPPKDPIGLERLSATVCWPVSCRTCNRYSLLDISAYSGSGSLGVSGLLGLSASSDSLCISASSGPTGSGEYSLTDNSLSRISPRKGSALCSRYSLAKYP